MVYFFLFPPLMLSRSPEQYRQHIPPVPPLPFSQPPHPHPDSPAAPLFLMSHMRQETTAALLNKREAHDITHSPLDS